MKSDLSDAFTKKVSSDKSRAEIAERQVKTLTLELKNSKSELSKEKASRAKMEESMDSHNKTYAMFANDFIKRDEEQRRFAE